jgi:hypothetical protein
MDLQQELAGWQRVLGVVQTAPARLEQHPGHRLVLRQGWFR